MRRKVLRIAILVALITAVGWQYRVLILTKIAGDRMFLREEFLYPTVYRPGDISLGEYSFFEKEVDCSKMERPTILPGRNILTNPGLDTPCGWVFVPYLGRKMHAESGSSKGGMFVLHDEDEYIFQTINLASLSDQIDNQGFRFVLSGRVRSSRPDAGGAPTLVCYLLDGVEHSDGILTGYSTSEIEKTGGRGITVSGTIPRGSRALRVMLRRGADKNYILHPAAYFDDLSLFLEPAD